MRHFKFPFLASLLLLLSVAFQAFSLPVQVRTELIECDICYNETPCPKFKPFDCHQNFCGDCMNSLFEKNINSACPMCRGPAARVPLHIDILDKVKNMELSGEQVNELLTREDISASLSFILNAYKGDLDQVNELMTGVNGTIAYDAALVATKKNNTETVELLLTHPEIDPSFDYNVLIFYAIRRENLPLVKALINHPKFNEEFDIYFVEAAENNNSEIISYLLDHPKVHPQSGSSLALFHAYFNENFQLLDRLLAYPSMEPQKAYLFIALVMNSGNRTLLNRVLNHPNADFSGREGNHAIMTATNLDRFDIVKLILDKFETDLTMGDDEEFEAIENTIKKEKWEIAQYLIERQRIYEMVKDFDYVREAVEAGNLMQPPRSID